MNNTRNQRLCAEFSPLTSIIDNYAWSLINNRLVDTNVSFFFINDKNVQELLKLCPRALPICDRNLQTF